MQLERQERLRQLTQELLQKSSKLDSVVLRQVDRRRVSVNSVREVLEAPDVPVLTEYAFHRHVYATG